MLEPTVRNQLFDMLATIAWGDVAKIQQRVDASSPTTPSFPDNVPPTPTFNVNPQVIVMEPPPNAAASASWSSGNQEDTPSSWPNGSQDAAGWGVGETSVDWGGPLDTTGGWGQASMDDWGASEWPDEQKKERKSRRSTSRRSGSLPEFGGEGDDSRNDQAWQAPTNTPRKKEKKDKAKPQDGRSTEDKLAEQMAAAQARMSAGLSQGKDRASDAGKMMSDRFQQGQQKVAQTAANSYAKKASGGLVSEVPPGAVNEGLNFAKNNPKQAGRFAKMFMGR
jgi:hypothetical protein